MVLDEKQTVADILKSSYQKLRTKNPLYSKRAFAKKLGVSSAALSEILNCKRAISKTKALALAAKINLNSKDNARLTAAFENTEKLAKLKKRTNPRKEVLLEKSEFDLMSDWRYFVFMALIQTADFKNDPKWIAKRMGISINEVTQIIERLFELNIISVNLHNEIKDNSVCYRTAEDFPGDLIRRRQLDGLEALTELIENQNELQFGAFSTITTDTKKIADAKIMIEDFLRRLSLFLCDSKDRQEVFELQIQLFPRTHREP